MSAPSDPPTPVTAGTPVWHYDGRTALRHDRLLVDGGEFFTLGDESIGWAELIASDAGFGRKRVPGWRVGFVAPPPAAIAAKLPGVQRYGRWVDQWGLWPAAGAFACVAALVVAGVLRTPALVARMVPASVEARLGDVMVGDFGRRGCTDPAGQAALAALVARIDPGDPAVEVHVVRLGMVNAVTLPGGRIVIFDGLLRAAASPDEVAGVIGHELGHVRHRDVTEALVRQLGLGVLLGGLEGHVGGYTNALLATAYSRGAEARADRHAMALLRDAAVSPAPTAAFFRRLGRRGGGAERLLAYVASHPVSSDRARAFAASGRPGAPYRPALDVAGWAALRGICRGTSDKMEWRF